MKRRDLMALVGGTAAAWPLPLRAQQPAMPVIGYLSSASPKMNAQTVAAFRLGLNETGYVEGRNVAIEFRWAENQYDRLPALAADLVRLQVAVIFVAGGTVTALAAKAASATIPIVFQIGADPVRAGLVASLNRPGGNVTGVSLITDKLIIKRLELLRELVPAAAGFALLLNPNSPNAEIRSSDVQEVGRAIGLQIQVLYAGTERDIDATFATLVQRRIGALLVQNDPLFIDRREQVVALAAQYGVPAIYERREFAAAGGLISYAPDITDAYRQAGIYAGRILKGAKPADLPVQQPTRIELVVNLKTAKALGLAIPPAILLRADEVIE